MTCKHCCDANQFFDLKSAQKELKRYKKKGAKGPTRLLSESIKSQMIPGESLLDIGGGIGALQWTVLENGGSHTTDVDASSAYIQTASDYAEERQWSEKANFVVGDFVDVHPEMEVHDIVTLDKVICCYPDFKVLLESGIDKTGRILALSFPVSNFISRFLAKLAALYFKWKKSSFKSYVHPSKQVHQFIEERGFKMKHKALSFPWNVYIYEKVS